MSVCYVKEGEKRKMDSKTEAKVRTTLYFTESFYKALKEVGDRESSMSELVEKHLDSYVKAHTNGNPQLMISTYTKPDGPSPMRVLCDFLRGATSEGQINCRRKGLWIKGISCYSCEKNQLRKIK